MSAIYGLTIRQLTGKWRLLILLGLVSGQPAGPMMSLPAPAMKKAGFVWTVAKLDAYLADPEVACA